RGARAARPDRAPQRPGRRQARRALDHRRRPPGGERPAQRAHRDDRGGAAWRVHPSRARPATRRGAAARAAGGEVVTDVRKARADDRYKWVALANTTAAIFMAALDGSIVIIALPAIFRGIHLDPLSPGNISYLLWMIMGYRLVQA